MNKFKKLGLFMALFFSFGVISQNISYINAQEIKEEKTEVSFYIQPYMQAGNYKVYLSDPISKKGIVGDSFKNDLNIPEWFYKKVYDNAQLIVPSSSKTIELEYKPVADYLGKAEIRLTEIWKTNTINTKDYSYLEFGDSNFIESKDGKSVSDYESMRPSGESGNTFKLIKSKISVSVANKVVTGDENNQSYPNLGVFENDNYPIKRNSLGEYTVTSISDQVQNPTQVEITYYYSTIDDEHQPGNGETDPSNPGNGNGEIDPSNPGNGNEGTDPNNPERPQLPETGGSEGENPSETNKPEQPQLPETGVSEVEKPQQPTNEGSNYVNKNEVPKLDKNKTNEKVKAANKVVQQQNKNKLNQEDSLPTTGSTSLVFGIIFSVIAIVGLIILNRYYQK